MPFTVTLPCCGGTVTETVVATPPIDADKSIAVAVLNVTVTLFAAAVGAPGVPTSRVAVAGGDVPPGPVAV